MWPRHGVLDDVVCGGGREPCSCDDSTRSVQWAVLYLENRAFDNLMFILFCGDPFAPGFKTGSELGETSFCSWCGTCSLRKRHAMGG